MRVRTESGNGEWTRRARCMCTCENGEWVAVPPPPPMGGWKFTHPQNAIKYKLWVILFSSVFCLNALFLAQGLLAQGLLAQALKTCLLALSTRAWWSEVGDVHRSTRNRIQRARPQYSAYHNGIGKNATPRKRATEKHNPPQ